MSKILLVDDETKFRADLAERLRLREYETIEAGNGEDAIKVARSDSDIDVVLLDLKMPGLSGEQTLAELKKYRPAIQVIMLTGHGSIASAMETGRLEAYAYLEKPCEMDKLLKTIEAAREDRPHVMARHEIPHVEKGSLKKWLIGSHNSRPGIILLGMLIFAAILLAPSPQRLIDILSAPKTGQMTDLNMGFAGYRQMNDNETIADYYSRKNKIYSTSLDSNGEKLKIAQSPQTVSAKARVMLATLVVAALFWASGAVPVGITALLVGVLMYFTGILRPDDIAKAYAKDAVIFIFGVLAMAVAISKTGLDRRIGLLLLGPAKTLPRLLFLFLPLLALACSFVSEHALVAFIMPLFMMVYVTSIRAAGIKKDRALAIMFALTLCYTANSGGPGSPAAGGRNAIMMGILQDYNMAPTFGEWMTYGMPFVPIMALAIAAYFFLRFRSQLKVKSLNVSAIVHKASEQIGPMNRNEYITAAVLVGVIALWIGASDTFGMGGPIILGLVLLNILRVLKWRDITTIHWEVIALYASASALGKGLAETGGALFLADSFLSILPDFMRDGSGLAMAASLFTGLTTNFMSDGATVSAIGPITVPMATISGTHPWMIGFATAFASSFAHMLIIGTPSNAIAYAMAKDPVTGEQLVTLSDFLKHGAVVLILSFAVLWGWTIFGYWRYIGF
ncbi:MAG: response regulator [candidate division Zixibacteria bacterium]|nr:response regulator [candidate division Zixibacteria bacterium]